MCRCVCVKHAFTSHNNCVCVCCVCSSLWLCCLNGILSISSYGCMRYTYFLSFIVSSPIRVRCTYADTCSYNEEEYAHSLEHRTAYKNVSEHDFFYCVEEYRGLAIMLRSYRRTAKRVIESENERARSATGGRKGRTYFLRAFILCGIMIQKRQQNKDGVLGPNHIYVEMSSRCITACCTVRVRIQADRPSMLFCCLPSRTLTGDQKRR